MCVKLLYVTILIYSFILLRSLIQTGRHSERRPHRYSGQGSTSQDNSSGKLVVPTMVSVTVHSETTFLQHSYIWQTINTGLHNVRDKCAKKPQNDTNTTVQ